MSRPQAREAYAEPVTPSHNVVHLRIVRGAAVERPLPFAKLTIAGIITGNALAFAWDAHGALAALAATIGVTL